MGPGGDTLPFGIFTFYYREDMVWCGMVDDVSGRLLGLVAVRFGFAFTFGALCRFSFTTHATALLRHVSFTHLSIGHCAIFGLVTLFFPAHRFLPTSFLLLHPNLHALASILIHMPWFLLSTLFSLVPFHSISILFGFEFLIYMDFCVVVHIIHFLYFYLFDWWLPLFVVAFLHAHMVPCM